MLYHLNNESRPRRQTQKHYKSARKHFAGNERAAAVRAFTAARLLLAGMVPNIKMAAVCCGSNTAYVAAALVLIRSENQDLIYKVRRGFWPLLETAQAVRPATKLVTAYRAATAADRLKFAKTVGVAELWDNTIVPVIS